MAMNLLKLLAFYSGQAIKIILLYATIQSCIILHIFKLQIEDEYDRLQLLSEGIR